MILTPMRPDALRHVQLGAGIFLTGLDLDGAASAAQLREQVADALRQDRGVLGLTRGGGSLQCKPVLRHTQADGLRLPTPETTFVDGWQVTLSGTLVELRPETLALTLPGASVTAEGRKTTLRLLPDLNPGAFVPRLVWVGDTLGGLMAVELRNALCTSGCRLTFGDRKEAALPFTFEAHADSQAEVPVRVVFLE